MPIRRNIGVLIELPSVLAAALKLRRKACIAQSWVEGWKLAALAVKSAVVPTRLTAP
jgi:hypothetical protein